MTSDLVEGDRTVTFPLRLPAAARNRIKAASALKGQSMRDYILAAVFADMGEEPPVMTVPRRDYGTSPARRTFDLMTASLTAFLASECRTGLPAGSYVESAALRDAFAAHPYGQDHAGSVTPVAFGRALARACPSASPDRARVNGRNVHVYRGIAFRD